MQIKLSKTEIAKRQAALKSQRAHQATAYSRQAQERRSEAASARNEQIHGLVKKGVSVVRATAMVDGTIKQAA